MSYKALVCTSLSKTFEEGIAGLNIQDMPRRAEIGSDQVRVKVMAAAVNFFDLLMLVGKYQYKPPLPFVPCSEGAGVVIEAGAESPIRVGTRVAFTSWSAGAAAEEIVIGANQCMPLPDTMTFEQASGFGVGYLTGYHALVQRGQLRKGETLLVVGAAGGMGVAAVQLGKLLGATVIAAASGAEKAAVLRKLGADHVVDYRTENLRDRVTEITGGHMADVIYDPVGGDVFDTCVRCIAGQGRLLVVGFASGRIPTLPVNMALIKGFSLVGVRAGAELAMHPELAQEVDTQLRQWAREGKLVPHVHSVVPLDRAKEAFSLLCTRTVVGKAVIAIQPASPRASL